MTAIGTGLSFIEERILRHLVSLIEEKIPEARSMILFGSRARGESDEESDLDLAIILDVPGIKKEHWERIWDLKWKVLESLGTEEFPLSLILVTLDDLVAEKSGFEKELESKGIVIWERNWQRPRENGINIDDLRVVVERL